MVIGCSVTTSLLKSTVPEKNLVHECLITVMYRGIAVFLHELRYCKSYVPFENNVCVLWRCLSLSIIAKSLHLQLYNNDKGKTLDNKPIKIEFESLNSQELVRNITSSLSDMMQRKMEALNVSNCSQDT